MSNTRKLINLAFNFVIKTIKTHNIDESHGLKHSMEVFRYAKKIYDSEIENNPFLQSQQNIIFMSAIGHDMCDKKYMDETEGVTKYINYLNNFEIMTPTELNVVKNIIETMSYSKVKVNGYPNLGEYMLAYHIVREADLLSAYDIDRCIMYKIRKDNVSYMDSLNNVIDLFNCRILRMRKDKLFMTKFSKRESLKLHKKSKKDLDDLLKLQNII